MIEKLIPHECGEYHWIDENGVSYQNKSDYIFNHIFGFCGCGNPSDMFMFIRDNLDRLKRKDWGEYEDKAYMMFVYWADSKGFIDHGTTIRCSWLDDTGEELLNDMNWCIENEEI